MKEAVEEVSRPLPSTGEENAMNASTQPGKWPQKHKTNENNAGIKHTQMQLYSIIPRKQHNTFPAFNISINYRAEVNSSTYRSMKTSPATSYVAATFHPTIGQLAHLSLSNTATPELGMIPLD